VRPLDCGIIVIANWNWGTVVGEMVKEMKVLEDVAYVLDAFCAFIDSIYFGFR